MRRVPPPTCSLHRYGEAIECAGSAGTLASNGRCLVETRNRTTRRVRPHRATESGPAAPALTLAYRGPGFPQRQMDRLCIRPRSLTPRQNTFAPRQWSALNGLHGCRTPNISTFIANLQRNGWPSLMKRSRTRNKSSVPLAKKKAPRPAGQIHRVINQERFPITGACGQNEALGLPLRSRQNSI